MENVRIVETGSFGELDTIREEEVDTGDLLSNLNKNTNHGSVENSVLWRETFGVADLSHLVVGIDSLFNLNHLELNVSVYSRIALTDRAYSNVLRVLGETS